LDNIITGPLLRVMITNAACLISNNKAKLNELNVFPVPDGDTGTNMSLTMDSAVAALAALKDDATATQVADAAAAAMLRGARGNSGVILSLLFRGLAKHIKGMGEIGPLAFCEALREGVDAAYDAVVKPAEGTMLTVSRLTANAALAAAGNGAGLADVCAAALEESAKALENTVNQNPVLQKAGVVDAGGMGFMFMIEGMKAGVEGRELAPGVPAIGDGQASGIAAFKIEDITFCYCTEFIVNKEGPGKDVLRLRALLESIGDSLVLVDDDEIIKIHTHTNNPGKALEEALAYGQLTAVKIENMRKQHTQQLEALPVTAHKVAPAEKPFGFVAVTAGDGMASLFKDLGVDELCFGGQTMNPSTQDILWAIDLVPAETVFVLPNNKNIIPAAQQAAPLTNKNVRVIRTKSIPQGLTALMNFNAELDADQNEKEMETARKLVSTGYITKAVRDSTFDGRKIKKGDYICIVDGRLETSGKQITAVLRRAAARMWTREATFVTIYGGEGADEEATAVLTEAFEKESKNAAEICVVDGGQPVYSYILAVE